MRKKWENYMNAARQVITDMRDALGLARPEGAQRVAGPTGTQWELDTRSWLEGRDGFLVIEGRQYSSPLKQESRAAMAWRIQADSDGGITAAALSAPAETPATASVEQMLLNDDSTANNYMAEFLSRRFRDVAAGADNY
ncbi:MAG: hypothetical protein KA945_05120 [Zoogloea sp.]|jgi:hypothetical protein|nr:hypothetical protein [Zoogloea sp.]